MRKTRNSIVLTAIVAMCLAQASAFAQGGLFSPQKVVNQYTTVGIGGGSSHYFGDLAPYRFFYHSLYKNVRWNGTINYTRYFTPQAAARVQFTWARILGDDYTFAQAEPEVLWRNYVRNLHFRNDIKEFTISGVFNILPQYSKGPRGRKTFMPYVSIGAGFIAHNPMAYLPSELAVGEKKKDNWIALRDLKTVGQGLPSNPDKPYSLVQAVIPVGFGIRYKINDKWDFTIEGGLRISPSDYLDDVGNDQYADPNELSRNFGPTSAALAQRSTEVFSRTGENRIPILSQIASDASKVNGISTNPLDRNLFASVEGFSAADDNGKRRGSSGRPDSYFLTQFTISYIISNKIQCPVIK
ncbi:hypothetical protein SAMN06298216_2694 [Spirosomataceae bacterium TFI 002]|nr:hypothetical protein SAMN06298216_2694 [Spirosomataceae bacterium TFI 002]